MSRSRSVPVAMTWAVVRLRARGFTGRHAGGASEPSPVFAVARAKTDGDPAAAPLSRAAGVSRARCADAPRGPCIDPTSMPSVYRL